ncbi:MAG: hypothetical protein GY898_08600 [Proteobacteria bacterium]|nr:hypothetical protein [Pseudomonadota bacterium]
MSSGILGFDLWTIVHAAAALVRCLLMAGGALALFQLGEMYKRPALQASAAGLALLTLDTFGSTIASTALQQMMLRGSFDTLDWGYAYGALGLVSGCAALLGWAMVSGGLVSTMMSGKPKG